MPRSRLPRRWTPSVARHQAGVFTRQQALDAGATADEIRWRRDSGLWVSVVGRALRHVDEQVRPASLFHGAQLTWPDGTLVLRAACVVNKFPIESDGVVHMVVGRHVQPWQGLVPHRWALRDDEVRTVDGLRVTTPARTLLDCLGHLPDVERQRLAAWATSRQLLGEQHVREWLDRGPRRGNKERRRLWALMEGGAASVGEHLLHDILRSGDVRGWVANAPIRVDDRIVASADVLFPAARLVLEMDGFAHHGRSRFQSDRARQNALVALGYRVLRFTWDDVTQRPQEVLRQVRTMLRVTPDASSRVSPERR